MEGLLSTGPIQSYLHLEVKTTCTFTQDTILQRPQNRLQTVLLDPYKVVPLLYLVLTTKNHLDVILETGIFWHWQPSLAGLATPTSPISESSTQLCTSTTPPAWAPCYRSVPVPSLSSLSSLLPPISHYRAPWAEWRLPL